MNIVDANLILRYLLQDAAQFIEQAQDKIEDHNIFIPNEVVAEVVYVLEKVYKVERVHFFDSLRNLLSYRNISMHDRNILIEALKVYSELISILLTPCFSPTRRSVDIPFSLLIRSLTSCWMNYEMHNKNASQQVRFELVRSIFLFHVVKMWSNDAF